ncbi:MFS transporter [Microvirga terricola]|uniref:MFS transporter n=1 Tax=Microvirga terricola TaxID=2719797 RepID=A0ABX0VAD5_9HYPH|nr:MFS transporter [Microvirga terricola]NIX76301.1 MFS transporter [Microvirga terricola]
MAIYDERTGRTVALLLIAGSGITSLARSMTLTFMALKLQREFGLAPAAIGAILGAGPLLGAVAAPLAGAVSDRVGRKRVFLTSLTLISLGLMGIGLSGSVVTLCVAQIVSAVALAVFQPMTRALISDAAPAHLRLRFFSWRHLVTNAGFAIGPMIGVATGTGSSALFVAASLLYASYGVVVLFIVPSVSGGKRVTRGVADLLGLRNLRLALRDRRLTFFLGGGTLLVAVYGQWSATLSQYVGSNFEDGINAFALLVMTNAIGVVLANVPARHVVERIGALPSLVLGCILFLAGEVGFALSSGLEMLVVSMVVFTLGEVLVVPSEYILVDDIANDDNRGSYFGAQAFSSIGSFLGPLLGGIALGALGGAGMFFLFSVFAALSALLFMVGHSLPPPKSTLPDAQRVVPVALDRNALSFGL